MDWGKAKSILIIIFLVLNIFLSYNLIRDKWAPPVSEAQIEASENILKERGITLKTQLPRNAGKATRLAFEGVAQFDMGKVTSKLLGKVVEINSDTTLLNNGDKQINIENSYTFLYTNKSPQEHLDLSSNKVLEKTLRKFFKDIGLSPDDLVLDYIESNQNAVVIHFVQKNGDYKVYNNSIQVMVSAEGIKSIHCSLQKPSSTKKNESIMPAYKVIFMNMWKSSGIVITSIDLGYTNNENDGEMTGYYERLHWRIRTEDGQIKFYDAVTGEPKG